MCEEFWEENRSFKGKSSTGFIVNVDIYLDFIFYFRRRKYLVHGFARHGFDAWNPNGCLSSGEETVGKGQCQTRFRCLESLLSVYLFRRRKLLVQSNVRSGFNAWNPFYLFIYSGDGNCWHRAMSDQVSML